MTKPHHLEKNFYEIRALLILQKLFGNEYNTLYRSECPDLISINQEFGVEITRAIDKKTESEHKYFNNKLKNHRISEINKNKLETFQNSEKLKRKIFYSENNIIKGYSFFKWHSNDLLIETIHHKIKLINDGNYKPLQNIDLYVFSDSFNDYDDVDINEIMRKTIDNQKHFKIKFRNIYFDDLYFLYKIDLHSCQYEKYYIKDIIHDICLQSRNIAENL